MATDPSTLAGRHVLLGVCGGIAAYKACELTSRLAQAGARVDVLMTRDARRFVAPLTFEALSGRAVRTTPWVPSDPGDTQHVKLTERADLMVVAPATANVLAKVAHGLCDDVVSLTVIAAACPVLFAPAMNTRMWEHPAVRANVARLTEWGYAFVGPEAGWLACRNVGAGRMSEPGAIVERVVGMLGERVAPPAPSV